MIINKVHSPGKLLHMPYFTAPDSRWSLAFHLRNHVQGCRRHVRNCLAEKWCSSASNIIPGLTLPAAVSLHRKNEQAWTLILNNYWTIPGGEPKQFSFVTHLIQVTQVLTYKISVDIIQNVGDFQKMNKIVQRYSWMFIHLFIFIFPTSVIDITIYLYRFTVIIYCLLILLNVVFY